MTSTRPDSDSALADRAQTFLDWTRINASALIVGAVVVVVAAAGFWFYDKSRALKQANAEKALLNAKQSMTAGNLPLAQTDLMKVYTQYGSTPAGVEAAMLLAQLDYDSGKFQDGVSMLQKVAGTSAASDIQPTILSLEGDGYAQMGKMAEAAKQYQSAADGSAYDNEKGYQLAKAARSYRAAGDTANARKIWAEIVGDSRYSTMATEARIRLGELTAAVAK